MNIRPIVFDNKSTISLLVVFSVGLIIGLLFMQSSVSSMKLEEDFYESRISFLEKQLDEMEVQQNELIKSNDNSKYEKLIDEYKIRNNELSSKINNLNTTFVQVENDLDEIRNEHEDVSSELDNYKKHSVDLEYKIAKLDENLDKIENDKLLIVELRKEVPIGREEARTYWVHVKSIAIKTDSNLGQSADKVLTKLDLYYDWLDQAPPDDAPIDVVISWLIDGNITGAVDYNNEITNFQNDALLSIITRMDSLITIIS